MDFLGILTGETRARLLRLLRGGPRSVPDLASELGISENAVRMHIAAAERDGLVHQVGVQRSTGGKPARLYDLTPGAEELFPKAYALVFAELFETLREEEGDEAAIERLRRVGRRLAALAPAAEDPAGRVRSAAALLESVGGSLEVVEEEGGWLLRSDGCPLSGLVNADAAVCALAESLVAEVTGRPVAEVCRREGRPRCAFRVSGEAPDDRVAAEGA